MKNKCKKLDPAVVKWFKDSIKEKYGTIKQFCLKNEFNYDTIRSKLQGRNPIFEEELESWFKILFGKPLPPKEVLVIIESKNDADAKVLWKKYDESVKKYNL